MSKIGDKLTAAPSSGQPRVKRGPTATCQGVYEPDVDDAEAVHLFRLRPNESWATAQVMYDKLAGVTTRIPNDKFRYHWKRRCGCWPDEQRIS